MKVQEKKKSVDASKKCYISSGNQHNDVLHVLPTVVEKVDASNKSDLFLKKKSSLLSCNMKEMSLVISSFRLRFLT